MAKVKSSEIPHYELLYIISNKFSEDELAPIKQKIEKLIANNQGQITFQDDWGKKRLAYPIKHFRHGYYHLLEFDLPADKIKVVGDYLRLSDQILRHQIIKKDKADQPIKKNKPQASNKEEITDSTPAEESVSKTQTTESQVEEKVEKPIIVAQPATTQKESPSTKEENKPAKKTADNESDKVEFKDLDDKLDQILDSDTFL